MEPDSQQQVRAIQGAVNLGMFGDASWGRNDLKQFMCNFGIKQPAAPCVHTQR